MSIQHELFNRCSNDGSYSSALYENLLALAGQQSQDYGLPYGRLWACADSTNLTLLNANTTSGYCKNTITAEVMDNIIPIMTSNTTPSGTASASSIYSELYDAFAAFDRSPEEASYWATPTTGMPQWLRYDFPSINTISAYTIVVNHLATVAHPATWSFQGSNNGTEWVDLDTQSDQIFTMAVKRTFTLSSSASYSKYRIYVTATNSVNVAITEMELLCESAAAYTNTATVIGNSYAVTGTPVAGRLILRGYNEDASAALDIGNSGSNKIELYRSIDNNASWSSAMSIEEVKDLGGNVYLFSTPEFAMDSASSIGFKIQSFARSVAPNFRILDVLAIWRD